MTEVAGLILGVVATWQTCIQVFDLVASSRLYGIDYEICRIKLEVERVRLLAWGDAVGLSGMDSGRAGPDARLNREQTRQVVLRVLGCIETMFKNNESLQHRYGLIQETPQPDFERSEQSQSSLSLIFRKAYANLKRTGRDRQQAGTVKQKTVWAIRDKVKFQRMVTEIHGFNDSLADLFPDLQIREALRTEVNQSNEIRPLTLLQEASADDHSDISDIASNRLEMLGATGTARSILSHDEDGRALSEGFNVLPPAAPAPAPILNETERADVQTEDDASVVDDLEKRLDAVELFWAQKADGALSVSMIGPNSYAARVTALVDWEGQNGEDRSSLWDDEDKGFVGAYHAAFELYRKREPIKRQRRKRYGDSNDEDSVLFDPESNPRYENVNPGTITVEGFALEGWDYEEQFGKRRAQTIIVSTADSPSISASRILRRLDQLRNDPEKLGWYPETDELNLDDFLCAGNTNFHPGDAWKPIHRIGDLYRTLNRTDICIDFTLQSSITSEWSLVKDLDGHGLWNFCWQIIVAKELSRRMEDYPDASISGLTSRVLASLIIADLWVENCEFIPRPTHITNEELKQAETPKDRAKAEDFKEKGNKALGAENFQEAVELYTKAMEIDLSNPIYRSNRSAALFSLGMYEDAYDDAWLATELDPKNAEAWARLGAAHLKLNDLEAAVQAYKTAIQIAGKNVTAAMKQGLTNAKAKTEEAQNAFDNEKDVKKKHALRGELLDAPWHFRHKGLEFRSNVHERQVEGLLLFAERMKWPYLNEARDYAEDVYYNFRGGALIPHHLMDWVFGMMLPGKWMSFKIMTALVLCSPSIAEKVGIAYYYDCGLVLQKLSYWRIRTVLGRILGALPNVQSLCGWIGPCPPIEFDPPLPGSFQPTHIQLKARRITPVQRVQYDNVIYLGNPGNHYDRHVDTAPRADEDLSAYIAEMTIDDSYIIPESPIKQLSTVSVQAVKLKKLPLDITIQQSGRLAKDDNLKKVEFRASIIFKIDNNEAPISYTLYTNPLFVTPPPCYEGPKGPHEVHLRELKGYQMEPWTVERLKDHVPDDDEEHRIMVVNATGKGAEVLARAWCSERGKNAIVRREGGPCYVCSINCAMMMNVGVLLWIS